MAGKWSPPGGILWLLDLIEEHRPAFDYDWRTRFHMSIEAIPDEMPWDEVGRLLTQLAVDPSSHVAAAMSGWSHPWTHEAFVLANLFDLMHETNSKKKPKPHPRPNQRVKTRPGRVKPRSQAVVRRALAARGHDIP